MIVAAPQPPAAPAARGARVALWALRLDLPAARLDALARLLSDDERAHAARYRFARHRDRYVAGRGLLRERLGALTGTAPAAVRFAYGPYGKPELAGEPALRFNASGAEGTGLLGVVEGCAIGVDVELRRTGAWDEDVVRHAFAPGEARDLLAAPAAERDDAFLRGWTRKEAYIKALGDGLQMPLQDFEVTLAHDEPARLRSCVRAGEVDRWSIADVSASVPGAVAAVCVESAGLEVRTEGMLA